MINKPKKYFRCNECKLFYKNKEWAKKCESFCKKYHACNTEIIVYAIRGE